MKPTLNLSCKKATELVEQQEFVKLGFVENIKLKLHLSICNACKKYHEQSKTIDTFFKNNNAQSIEDKTQEEQLKSTILNNLKNL